MRPWMLLGLMCAGCSFDPPPEIARDADVTQPDALPDAISPDADDRCDVDSFDGTALQAHWSLLVGELPTYDVTSSRVRISDAPRAPTPSTPPATTSWIYDLDQDKGNQVAWAHAIGGEDFSVTAELAWSSVISEITYAAIAVVDAQGVIAALAGVADSNLTTSTGYPYARLRGPAAGNDDQQYFGPDEEPGGATVRIARASGTIRIFVDDVEVVSGPSAALISHVSIVYLQHSDDSGASPYGSAEIRSVEVCRP